MILGRPKGLFETRVILGPGRGDPAVVFSVDEFGPLNLQPHPGRQWTTRGGGGDRPRRRRRATYTRTAGVRHLFARLRPDPRPGLRAREAGQEPDDVLRVLPLPALALPADVRIAIGCDNFGPHPSTGVDGRIGHRVRANNVELAYNPTNCSWLNRIEDRFQSLRYFPLDGTDHGSHREQTSMTRRYHAWRNRHAEASRVWCRLFLSLGG